MQTVSLGIQPLKPLCVNCVNRVCVIPIFHLHTCLLAIALYPYALVLALGNNDVHMSVFYDKLGCSHRSPFVFAAQHNLITPQPIRLEVVHKPSVFHLYYDAFVCRLPLVEFESARVGQYIV